MTNEPLPNGWIPYDGSGQPVAGDVVVSVWLRHETLEDAELTSESACAYAGAWEWGRAETENDGDIIAYRVVNR